MNQQQIISLRQLRDKVRALIEVLLKFLDATRDDASPIRRSLALSLPTPDSPNGTDNAREEFGPPQVPTDNNNSSYGQPFDLNAFLANPPPMIPREISSNLEEFSSIQGDEIFAMMNSLVSPGPTPNIPEMLPLEVQAILQNNQSQNNENLYQTNNFDATSYRQFAPLINSSLDSATNERSLASAFDDQPNHKHKTINEFNNYHDYLERNGVQPITNENKSFQIPSGARKKLNFNENQQGPVSPEVDNRFRQAPPQGHMRELTRSASKTYWVEQLDKGLSKHSARFQQDIYYLDPNKKNFLPRHSAGSPQSPRFRPTPPERKYTQKNQRNTQNTENTQTARQRRQFSLHNKEASSTANAAKPDEDGPLNELIDITLKGFSEMAKTINNDGGCPPIASAQSDPRKLSKVLACKLLTAEQSLSELRKNMENILLEMSCIVADRSGLPISEIEDLLEEIGQNSKVQPQHPRGLKIPQQNSREIGVESSNGSDQSERLHHASMEDLNE